MTATRRQAREWAIQMLMAADLNPPDDVPSFMASIWEELSLLDENEGRAEGVRGKLKAFAEERVAGVLAEMRDIDGALAPLLEHWDMDRLGSVERAVLRMAVWELKSTDVPRPVVVNEAVDLVNWFSSPKSRSLVNGVLRAYIKECLPS